MKSAEARLLDAIFGEGAAEDVEAEERLTAQRARKALQQAPELAQHIRSLMRPSDGRTESGEEFRVMRTPLLTTETDDSDEFYARVLGWVENWSDRLGAMPPAPVLAAYRGRGEVLGMPSYATPAGAWTLMDLLAGWLLRHDEQIAELNPEGATVFREDVIAMVWALRAKYKLTPAREKPVRPAPCPVCGERAIGAIWRSTDVLDVEISCENCGWVIPTPRASQIIRWVQLDALTANGKSEACELLKHAACTSVNCSCSCHLPADVEVGHGEHTPVDKGGKPVSVPASTDVQDPRTCRKCWLIHPEGACQG